MPNKDIEKRRAYIKQWRLDNPERNAKLMSEWVDRNRPRARQHNSQYGKSTKGKLRRNERNKQRRETDDNFKIISNLRSRLYLAVKKSGAKKKAADTFSLVGCDIQFLRGFLEARFLPGMTWKNYGKGKGKWAIDHHIPCAEFDLRESVQQRQCFSYTNLRPMWEPDNQSKGAKRPPMHQAELI